jgi:NAD(P)-dependent dehydrogenase (short-subunit alcohol dehydrogenase family)
MPGRLDQKVAVITGAAGGIGRASAVRFAAEGAHVVAADLAGDGVNEVAELVGGIGVRVDVTDADGVQSMYRRAVEAFGGVDILFNNAGISPPEDDSILTTEADAWARVQAVNLTSV